MSDLPDLELCERLDAAVQEDDSPEAVNALMNAAIEEWPKCVARIRELEALVYECEKDECENSRRRLKKERDAAIVELGKLGRQVRELEWRIQEQREEIELLNVEIDDTTRRAIEALHAKP